MSSVNDQEVEKFASMAGQWWDKNGPLRTLHQINQCRMDYILNIIRDNFYSELHEISALDIGCGGGIATEQLYKSGIRDITGIDAAKESVEIAKSHALQHSLDISYLQIPIEELALQPKRYDVVMALEIIEHVEKPLIFLQNCAQLVKENGLLFISTISRTLKSLVLAKIAAEYIVNLLPKGTHSWQKFLKPSEIILPLERQNYQAIALSGIQYHPFSSSFSLCENVDMNYIVAIKKIPSSKGKNK